MTSEPNERAPARNDWCKCRAMIKVGKETITIIGKGSEDEATALLQTFILNAGPPALPDASGRIDPLASIYRQRESWMRSTGPRIPAGKDRTKMYAWKHGERSTVRIAERRERTATLRMFRRT